MTPPKGHRTFWDGDHPPRVVTLTKQTTNNKEGDVIQYLLDTWYGQNQLYHADALSHSPSFY